MKVRKPYPAMARRLKSLSPFPIKCFLWEENGELMPGIDVYVNGRKFSVSSDSDTAYRQIKSDLQGERYHSRRPDPDACIREAKDNQLAIDRDFENFKEDFAHHYISSLGNRSVVLGYNE